MGLIAKLLQFTRRGAADEAQSDAGGGNTLTATSFSNANSDSHPLPDDYVALVPIPQSGRVMAVGYHDAANERTAAAGENVQYSRNEAGEIVARTHWKNDGSVVTYNAEASVELLADGTVKGDNAAGSFELQAGGNFIVNGVTIDTDGNITTPGNVEAAEVKATDNDVTLGTHNHGGPPPTPGT